MKHRFNRKAAFSLVLVLFFFQIFTFPGRTDTSSSDTGISTYATFEEGSVIPHIS